MDDTQGTTPDDTLDEVQEVVRSRWRLSFASEQDYDFNPPFHLQEYEIVRHDSQKVNITLIDDGKLFGGSKTRGLAPYIRHCPSKVFCYAGPGTAAGAFALSVVCNYYHKKAVLYIVGNSTPTIRVARKLGASVLTKFRSVDAAERRLARDYPPHKGTIIPFGMHDSTFQTHLTSSFMDAWPKSHCPRRVWIACGSCVLLRALAATLPLNTIYCIVQVGVSVWPDILDEFIPNRYILYDVRKRTDPINGYTFVEPARILPPWGSYDNYDAKIYELLLQHAEDGDYVMNVASQHNLQIPV